MPFENDVHGSYFELGSEEGFTWNLLVDRCEVHTGPVESRIPVLAFFIVDEFINLLPPWAAHGAVLLGKRLLHLFPSQFGKLILWYPHT